MTYEVEFHPVSSGYYNKWSENDTQRGGAFTSYVLRILRDGEEYVDTGTYVSRLNPHNTRVQDAYIREHAYELVLEHDEEFSAAHVIGKAAHLLAALRACGEEA